MTDDKAKKGLSIIRRLTDGGFAAYFAGGYVRDRILGVPPKDYDIATNATPEAIRSLFDNTIGVGAKFGVIVVVIGDDQFEVATFRADAPYIDGRRPSAVHFGTIEEDACRRDFTIGGMYFDPIRDVVIDLVDGVRDLRAGIIRAIGDVNERFEEDHLRMLRAVRFAARLGFAIDPATYTAIKRGAPQIGRISAERVGDEIVRIMTEGGSARGMDLLIDSGLAAVVLPEVIELGQCPQPANFHPEGDVYRHTRLMLSMLPRGCSETLAFGALFHDIAKPRCLAIDAAGKMTYYGHTDHGAQMAIEILSRFRRSRFVQDRVSYLVRYHLRMTDAQRMRPATLKRMVSEEGFGELLDLSLLDALASSSYLGFYHFCRRAMAEMPTGERRPPRLVSGHDLIGMGFRPGPEFKRILTDVEDLHLDGAIKSRDEALEYVRANYAPEPE